MPSCAAFFGPSAKSARLAFMNLPPRAVALSCRCHPEASGSQRVEGPLFVSHVTEDYRVPSRPICLLCLHSSLRRTLPPSSYSHSGDTLMAQQNSAVWFITGCSTGFGRELAKMLLDRGYRVVVTARNPKQIQDLAAGHDKQALALQLDVTNASEIAEAVKKAEAAFGGIDVLVNNAGYGYLSAIEEGEDNEVRAMFEDEFLRPRAPHPGRAPGNAQAPPRHDRQHFLDRRLRRISRRRLLQRHEIRRRRSHRSACQRMRSARHPGHHRRAGPFRTDWAGRSLKTPKNAIADYAETAVARRKAISGGSGKQAGDPIRACARDHSGGSSPKSRRCACVLGRMALDTARAKMDQFRSDLEAGRNTSLGADYPEAKATTAR